MKRLTLEFVRKEFEKEGYILLSNLYINSNKQYLYYVCPNGHKHNIKYGNWQRGVRCPYCKKNGKPKIGFIRSEFKKEGYIILTNTYTNSYTKLNYICPLGHNHSVAWSDWYHHNSRCPSCAGLKHSERISGNRHHNWKGGVSCEPYCDVWLDKDFKESIKERDGYMCLNPVCTNKIKQLSIHHIDYNKKNCKPSNLITLCRSCNSSANFNRGWHQSWYKTIMNNRIKNKEE